MLLYLSTPALRRQLIFLMNFLSVTVGIAFNFGLAVYNLDVIHHPEVPFDPTGSLAVLICAILLPIFIRVILAFRLYVVLPRRNAKNTPKRLFYLAAASFVFPRILGIVQLVFAFRGKGVNASYIFFTTVNVEIVCSVLATLWTVSYFCTIFNLPVEVVDEIIGHIDDSQTLLNCLLTNRHFKPRILYKTVHIRGKQLEAFRSAIDASPHYAKYTTALTIHGLSSAQYGDLNYILCNTTNIRFLDVEASAYSSARTLLGPLPTLKNLTVVVWYGDYAADIISACQGTLTHIELSSDACRSQRKPFGGSVLPNLRSIRLPHGSGCPKPGNIGLRADEWKAGYF
ncbi:hypothetical protein EYR40_006160 [Pleurotus pulmonarius]|nr:hypothetical protein EYR40_006160 [Pleurotus pulmonarius]